MFSTKAIRITPASKEQSQSPQFGSMFSTRPGIKLSLKCSSLNPLNSGQCFQLQCEGF
ncbi:hypothetical protein D1AOALGA4SA_11695 [Olavius algarvensis Delta 1 endosymbiont]|nr:hypothetical protein D1AOALGA4SA_11695 [Olavius algarvensis Delta 1 endosymbiont]